MEGSIEYNPFLCNDCQKYGYCRKPNKDEQQLKVENRPINWKIIWLLDNALPVKTTLKPHMLTFGQMQKAHDAFQQDDFESAFLHYTDLLKDGYYHWEAFLGLALCSYYTEKFEEAVRYINQVEVGTKANFLCAIMDFTEVCDSRLKYIEATKIGENPISCVTHIDTQLHIENRK